MRSYRDEPMKPWYRQSGIIQHQSKRFRQYDHRRHNIIDKSR